MLFRNDRHLSIHHRSLQHHVPDDFGPTIHARFEIVPSIQRTIGGFLFAVLLIGTATAGNDDNAVAGTRTHKTGDARVVAISLAAPDVLFVRVEEGEVQLGKLVDYDRQPNDEWIESSPTKRYVKRNGEYLGDLAGSEQNGGVKVRLPDHYFGKRAELSSLTNTSNWTVNDNRGRVDIDAIHRKSRVLNIAETGLGRPEVCWRHDLFFKLGRTASGLQFEVQSTDPLLGTNRSNDPSIARISPSIHVSVIGFRPSDPLKHAFLSCWMGDGGGIHFDTHEFAIRNLETNDIVLRGKTQPHRKATEPADHRGLQKRPNGYSSNYAGVDTWRIDFSKLIQPGRYEILVRGIGRSEPFTINDRAYRPVIQTALQGLKAHRWGEDRA